MNNKKQIIKPRYFFRSGLDSNKYEFQSQSALLNFIKNFDFRVSTDDNGKKYTACVNDQWFKIGFYCECVISGKKTELYSESTPLYTVAKNVIYNQENDELIASVPRLPTPNNLSDFHGIYVGDKDTKKLFFDTKKMKQIYPQCNKQDSDFYKLLTKSKGFKFSIQKEK